MKQSTFIKIYIIPFLIMSPFMTISCNAWFTIWLMLEFNLMIFIPFIIFFNKFYKELSMKYFLIQTISSSTLIIMTNSFFINININMMNWMIIIINLSLFMKLGLAPFHSWFINMMMNMNWINCLILSTWQKIIPMIIIMYIYNFNLMSIIIINSAIIGSIMGINHQSLRIILTYSSINHMSWMLINLMMSEMLWMLYFFSYSMINMSVMLIFNKFNIFYMNQMFTMNHNSTLMIMINFMSMSGLPPFYGFIMKWLSIYFMIWNKMEFINIIIIMLTIITFVYYMRICLSCLLIQKMNNKLMLINKFSKFNMMFILFFFNFWMISMWLF